MNKYSLWILPDEKVTKILSNEIERLGKKYDFEPFEPHLSLMGVILSEEEKVRKKSKELASTLHSFALHSAEVSFSTTFFQNVFVRMTPTAALTNAFLASTEKFDMRKDFVYMPHISLVYGNHDMKTREKIMKEVQLPKLEFEVKRIFLFDTNSEDYTQWRKIEEFKFT